MPSRLSQPGADPPIVAYFMVRSSVGVRGRRWRWVLVAANNEVVATSQHYRSQDAALGGIAAVRRIAHQASTRFDLSDGQGSSR